LAKGRREVEEKEKKNRERERERERWVRKALDKGLSFTQNNLVGGINRLNRFFFEQPDCKTASLTSAPTTTSVQGPIL
jgi:hypothetical protein